jgi:RimJ/RimL family protein N-acetyltransferase
LQVGRLRLVAISPEMLAAEHSADYVKLGKLLRARITREWPPQHWEPHVFAMILKQYENTPESFGWHRYVLLRDRFGAGRRLVGAVGGFAKYGGDVEIGYSTLPEFQRRGFATAFAGELVGWLLSLDGVRSVSAQTYPSMTESIKVMERCGMSHVGAGDDAGTVRYRRVR